MKTTLFNMMLICCLGIGYATHRTPETQVSSLLEAARQQLNTSMDKAVESASQALILAEEHHLPLQAARAQFYLAKGYHQTGMYDKALQRCQQALSGFEKLDDKRGMADAYEQLGNIYWRLKNTDQVQENYQKSLSLRRKYGSEAELADALNNIGIVSLHYLNQAVLAKKYFDEALALSEQAGFKLGRAHSLSNIGNYYLMNGDIDQALTYNLQSLSLYREVRDFGRVAINTLIVGYLYNLKGDPKTAEKMYFEALELAKGVSARSTIRDTYLNLSALYEDQGNNALHLKYYKEYSLLAESILSEETSRNIANLQTQHAVEKKELENRILRLNLQKQRMMLIFLAVVVSLAVIGIYLILKEKRKSERLLLNILPRKVAKELKQQGYSLPQTFPQVSVLFSDFVDFTRLSSTVEAKTLIGHLSLLFTEFDNLCEKYCCERIKTIGDAYLAVCGLPQAYPDHAFRILKLAKDMLSAVTKYNQSVDAPWQIRIGLHCGDVVGGIVGIKKYIYDVFGDTINTASRMESNSLPMRINVSEDFYLCVRDEATFEERSPLEVKGKGIMKMYFVAGTVLENIDNPGFVM